MRSISSLLPFFFVLLTATVAEAQDKPVPSAPVQPRASAVSPEVHSDGRVTFHFRSPNTVEVKLMRDGAEPVAMQKDEQGMWSVTTSPLAPDYYGYSFLVDGEENMDPQNSMLIPNLLTPASAVHVPGPSSLPWELNDVPHGEIHHHFYRSKVAADDRDYHVYTPAGYDPGATKTYPVLYLLHGFSDDASGWIAVGHANVILDNLIAQGKAKPMIVVMPLGYGGMEFVRQGWNAWDNDAEMRQRNFDMFREALLTEVMPPVESQYRITKDRNARAIAGLSMGGTESLLTGLNNLDRFSWVGAFSSGRIPEDFQKHFPTLDAKANQQLHLLWIACGTEDGYLTTNRKFREWLKVNRVKETEIETAGAHTWMVWRRNLAEFARLLFR
jgi:enterochelin esterase-like enzyme